MSSAPLSIAQPRRSASVVHWLLVVAVLAGAVLRFTWNTDMEYKGDEHWMFERSQRVGRSEPWPALGMGSSVGIPNPGLSVWTFVALARVFRAKTPLQLDRAVVTLNDIALMGLLLFAFRAVPDPEREVWLWGLALAAVSPMAIILQRKIWAQCVLPAFCVLFLLGWWYRHRIWGALLWGMLGALIGQIHMSGYFFAAGFFLWTLLFSWKRFGRKRVRWPFWAAGSVLGLLPAIPWIRHVLGGSNHGPAWRWATVKQLLFFKGVFKDAFGLGLDYSLGGNTHDFLAGPWVGSGSVHPVLWLNHLCWALAVVMGGFVAWALWRGRRGLRHPLERVGRCSDTGFAVQAAIFAFGALITLAGVHVYRHYLIVTFPFEWLLVALVAMRWGYRPRWFLSLLLLAQLGLSISFLTYVHVHGGAPRGDYGRAYRGK